MWTAVINGEVIAASDNTQQVEGNQYFPIGSIKTEFLTESSKTTVCSWKGTANYFNLVVNGETKLDAAWIYQTPKDAASSIAGHVAFGRDVEVTKAG